MSDKRDVRERKREKRGYFFCLMERRVLLCQWQLVNTNYTMAALEPLKPGKWIIELFMTEQEDNASARKCGLEFQTTYSL